MSTQTALQLPTGGSVAGLAASWTLSSARAVKFGAASGGFLQVDKGTVWLTLDGPHPQGPANDWGDVVLRSGTRIHVTAGQHVVLERYCPAANEPVCFSWEPDTDADVATPLRGLRSALRSVLAGLRQLPRVLLQWLAPGPPWPNDLAREYENIRDDAWRNLRYLRINQP